MPRLMSVALTEQAVIERRKTVTRRLGWTWLEPGTRLTLCRKVMGRRRADGTVEPLVRLADVEVTDVRQEPLWMIAEDDITAEGVPHSVWAAHDPDPKVHPTVKWAEWFATQMRCSIDTPVTRIEWRYLDGPDD